MWNKISSYFKTHFLQILLVLATFPILLYVSKFHSCKLSEDPADWGVFGDYIGGVYSVLIAILVVFITRNLSRLDEEKRLKKEAIREIYKQITNIQQKQTVDQRKLTKLYKLIEDGKLFITPDLYERLKKLANYFGENGRYRTEEITILEELREEYVEK
jgi:hypothetical protein